MNKPIIIIGNGGHGAVLTDILLANNKEILGFTAPKKETNSFGLKYLGDDESILSFPPESIELVLGLGSIKPTSIRSNIYHFFKDKGYSFSTCIHPNAIISPSASINEGVQIMAGAIIQPRANISENSIINTGAVIEHDCKIGKHVHIAPGVVMSGNVQIGESSHIGTGAKIIQNITIGNYVMVAAGAVVIKNIESKKTVMGIPAKEVK